MASWRERILHIAHHYRQGAQLEHMRPDFFVVEHLEEKGFISAEDYKSAVMLSERPSCDGLVDFGYKTPDMRWKAERNSREKYDLEKEERLRKRQGPSKSKGKGSKGR